MDNEPSAVASPWGEASSLKHPSFLPASGPWALHPSLSGSPWWELILTKYPVPGAPLWPAPSYISTQPLKQSGRCCPAPGCIQHIVSSVCGPSSSVYTCRQPDTTHPLEPRPMSRATVSREREDRGPSSWSLESLKVTKFRHNQATRELHRAVWTIGRPSAAAPGQGGLVGGWVRAGANGRGNATGK